MLLILSSQSCSAKGTNYEVSLWYLCFKTTVHKTLQKMHATEEFSMSHYQFRKMFEMKYTKCTYTYSLSKLPVFVLRTAFYFEKVHLHNSRLMQTRMNFAQHTLHRDLVILCPACIETRCTMTPSTRPRRRYSVPMTSLPTDQRQRNLGKWHEKIYKSR
jgi:hypothetical protein